MKTTTPKKIILGILASLVLCINANALTDVLKVKISNGSISDETIIRFLPTATNGFDGSSDSYKLFSTSTTVPAIFTNIDPTSHLSINALPSLSTATLIPVFTHIKVAATYTFQSIELGAFDPSTRIVLEDTQTGEYYYFRNGASVSIPLTVNTVSSPNRFVVRFLPSAGTSVTNSRYIADRSAMIINEPIEVRSALMSEQPAEAIASLNAYPQEGSLMLELSTSSASSITVAVFNMMGQQIFYSDNTNSYGLSEKINIAASGNYIVRAVINDQLINKKISITK